MHSTYAVVLAAGKGTRMKSDLPKVLHPVCGKPMVEHITDHLKNLNTNEIVTVVGHKKEMIQEQLGQSVKYAVQEEQLGTAHAVKMSEELLGDKEGTTLIITGDTPLITEKTLDYLLKHHHQTNAAGTILTMLPEDPSGYGRIVRNASGNVKRIVEQKDATEDEKEIQEVNTGIFCFDNQLLFSALQEVDSNNNQSEYYLPDVIEILQNKQHTISASVMEDVDEGLGINDRIQLSKAEQIMQQRILETHMKNGVTIVDPKTTFIEADVVIGRDTTIEPRTHLRGQTRIGKHCVIGPDVDLLDYDVKDQMKIHNFSMTNDVCSIPLGS
ncbi:bifunctional UDP-N-acetylglucosamine diphosphorylase/glucosamine-1-phosphate N-acetyltransferase GlmU [Pontibacillus sp. HMF3514]|uniref:bifunctional UDP-N-acetylglucosamine diphosphorylase/glucosamine-1-phosphate N-acetyltransferase GlmU n=1 Tax=Pontibacillus sp. HMF3514 TaxID=2692425 RepID=UPI00132013DB|nr:bifunctional UDP-N-acetylglucosamine diphosphorylase/glucosamine-1-phosphate N-acetyltransferase GlmU [Pontibacillus sp. HMF3514]QHE54087.1 UDP-N-acetylglucosamine diphosphorylase/glucosamine-1-phosphate N-acetyltransferase [Pontibacillus sp. HMF3514]